MKSSQIDWSIQNGPVYGIRKALLANEWLLGPQEEDPNPAIEDVVKYKLSFRKQHKPKLASLDFDSEPANKLETPHFPADDEELFLKEAYGSLETEEEAEPPPHDTTHLSYSDSTQEQIDFLDTDRGLKVFKEAMQSLEMRIGTNIAAIEARLNTMETKINHNTDNVNKIIKY